MATGWRLCARTAAEAFRSVVTSSNDRFASSSSGSPLPLSSSPPPPPPRAGAAGGASCRLWLKLWLRRASSAGSGCAALPPLSPSSSLLLELSCRNILPAAPWCVASAPSSTSSDSSPSSLSTTDSSLDVSSVSKIAGRDGVAAARSRAVAASATISTARARGTTMVSRGAASSGSAVAPAGAAAGPPSATASEPVRADAARDGVAAKRRRSSPRWVSRSRASVSRLSISLRNARASSSTGDTSPVSWFRTSAAACAAASSSSRSVSARRETCRLAGESARRGLPNGMPPARKPPSPSAPAPASAPAAPRSRLAAESRRPCREREAACTMDDAPESRRTSADAGCCGCASAVCACGRSAAAIFRRGPRGMPISSKSWLCISGRLSMSSSSASNSGAKRSRPSDSRKPRSSVSGWKNEFSGASIAGLCGAGAPNIASRPRGANPTAPR